MYAVEYNENNHNVGLKPNSELSDGLENWDYSKKISSLVAMFANIDDFVDESLRELAIYENVNDDRQQFDWVKFVKKVEIFYQEKIDHILNNYLYGKDLGIVLTNKVSLNITKPEWDGKTAQQIVDDSLSEDNIKRESKLSEVIRRIYEISNDVQ
jgi:hypothetical protein